MNHSFDWFLYAVLLCSVPLLLLGSVYRQNLSVRARWTVHLTLGLLALLAVVVGTRFGQLHRLPIDRNLNARSSTTDPANTERERAGFSFHLHEIAHYYLGSKYMNELQYSGLYDCILLADSESFNFIDATVVRNLADVHEFIPATEARRIAQDTYRPRFSDERWAEFKKDVVLFQHLSTPGLWNGVLQDAGMNAPPTWAVVAGTLANAFPLNHRTYWWLPLIDVILLAAGCFLLYRAFGVVGVTSFLIVYGASFIGYARTGDGIYGYNGAAFARYMELFGIIAGLTLLKSEKYVWAGVCLGLSTCLRVFPLYFAVGAALPLIWDQHRGRGTGWRAAKQFCLGFAAISAVLVALSLWMYGLETWRVFIDRIWRHSDLFFDNHLGFKKLLTFDAWDPQRRFWGPDGLQERFLQSWSRHLPLGLGLQLLIGTFAVIAARKRSPMESALFIGLMGMYLLHMPAHYYYAVWSLVPVILFRPEARWSDVSIGIAFVAMLAFVGLRPVQWEGAPWGYYSSWAILAFLLVWTGVRLLNLRKPSVRVDTVLAASSHE